MIIGCTRQNSIKFARFCSRLHDNLEPNIAGQKLSHFFNLSCPVCCDTITTFPAVPLPHPLIYCTITSVISVEYTILVILHILLPNW